MQALELALIAGGVLVASAFVAVQYRRLTVSDRRWPKLLLGVVPGLVGAVLILAPRVDLIPDENESAAWIAALVLITAAAAAGTAYRLARH